MNSKVSFILSAALLLSGCGTMPEERAISGAGIGAGAGAVLGAVTGLTVLQAAAIGATTGALTGALTKEHQINLGKPAWKEAGDGQPPASHATVRRVQSALTARGYDPGPADGILGEKTRAAIRNYQADHGLLVDGRATPELVAHLNGGA